MRSIVQWLYAWRRVVFSTELAEEPTLHEFFQEALQLSVLLTVLADQLTPDANNEQQKITKTKNVDDTNNNENKKVYLN